MWMRLTQQRVNDYGGCHTSDGRESMRETEHWLWESWSVRSRERPRVGVSRKLPKQRKWNYHHEILVITKLGQRDLFVLRGLDRREYEFTGQSFRLVAKYFNGVIKLIRPIGFFPPRLAWTFHALRAATHQIHSQSPAKRISHRSASPCQGRHFHRITPLFTS